MNCTFNFSQRMEGNGEETIHPALSLLQRLLNEGQITEESYRDLSFKFQKLHKAFEQSCSTEQTMMRKTRDLDRELKSQKLTIQNTASNQQEHRQQLAEIRQFVTNTQAELEQTQEQIEATTLNTQVKQKELAKLEAKVEKAREALSTRYDPQRMAMQNEIMNIEKAIASQREKITNLDKQRAETVEKIQKADEQLLELDKAKRASNQKILDISSIPIKTRQKCSTVESSHNTMLSEEKSANEQLKNIEHDMVLLQNRSHDMETEFNEVSSHIAVVTGECNALREKFEHMKATLSELTNVKQQKEFEVRKMQRQISEYDKEIANLDQRLDSLTKDISKKDQQCQRMDEVTTRVMVDKQALEGQLHIITQDKAREASRNANLNKEMQQQTKEKEEQLKKLVMIEQANEKLLKQISEQEEDRNRRQLMHDQLNEKERELIQQLSEASLIRDRKAREIASMKKKTMDAKTLVMEKNLDFLGLCRKFEMFQIQMREYSELYEKVKMDRNRHVNTIQTSKQLVMEMKEKIKILENEVQVLRGEYEQIAFAVKLQKNELTEAFKKRDATKVELKKSEVAYRELQSKIDFQAGETDRMNHILQSLEERINYQQVRYTTQADDCAARQRMLIDKQDELCIIYEQFNRHEEIMKKGEIALRERDEQIRLLNLEVRDFARRIDIMQRKIPQLRSYNEEIQELEQQLAKERVDVENVTKRLEVPGLKERQRAYCGKDFTLKELEDKVALYEQRINSKEQQLWEKQILLKEIEDKINQIKGEATRDISATQKVIERGGKMRFDVMNTHRRLLATLSEMAIYEAQTAELQMMKEEIKRQIESAEERTARGESFDESAERLLRMHVRDMEMAANAKARSAQMWDDDDDEDNRRAGRQKFDAYPTADGLSRPYGAFPVFQPAPPPSYIRHYRKEGPRAIEI